MRKLLIPVGIGLLALASCSSGNDNQSAETTTTPADAFATDTFGTSDTFDTTTTGSTFPEDYPCTLVDDAAAAQLFGNEVESDAVTNYVTENDNEWTNHDCEWTSLETDPTEGTLAISEAADFPDGQVGCPEVLGDSVSLPDLGDSASWQYEDAGTTITVGNLRVCTSTGLVDIEVSGVGTEDELQAIAVELANTALADL